MVLSSAIWTHALGVYSVPAALAPSRPARVSETPINSPPEVMAVVLRKSRRDVSAMWFIGFSSGLAHRSGGVLDGGAHPGIGAATADVAAHRGIDVRVGRILVGGKQSGGAHELAGLAVAALRHVVLDPSYLQRMRVVPGQAFDRADTLALNSRQRGLARAQRLAIDMHRASPAQALAAAEFGAGETEFVPDHPQQRGVGFGLGRNRFAV